MTRKWKLRINIEQAKTRNRGNVDTNTTIIIIIIAFVVVAIVALFRFNQQGKIGIRGPFSTGLDVEGSNKPPAPTAGIKASSIKSRKGGLTAHDEAGGTVDAEDVDVEKDVILKRSQGSETQLPKVPPSV